MCALLDLWTFRNETILKHGLDYLSNIMHLYICMQKMVFNHHSQHISDYVLFDNIFGIKFVFILFFKYLHLFI